MAATYTPNVWPTLVWYALSLTVLLLLWRSALWHPRRLPGIPSRRPLLIGHRGTVGPQRENTLAAFRAAFDSGLDGIECDVQRSRDGVLVLHHDFEIEGRAVRDLTLAELRSLDPHLATLGTLLVLADTHPGRLLNLELKSDRLRDGGLARSLAAAVRSAGLADRVLVSSFNPWALLTLRLVEPSLRTAMLFAPDLPRSLRSPWLAGWLHVDALHPRHDRVTAELLRGARKRGLMVNTWTVNEAASVKALTAAGVDGIMADDPAALRRAVEGGPGWKRNSK